MATYIPDGYTAKGYAKAQPGLYDAVRFQYRPMTYQERSTVTEGLRKKSGAEGSSLVFAVLAKYLVSWDVKHDGKELPLPADSGERQKVIARLQPNLIDKLYGIVAGLDPSDVDEAESSAEQASKANDELTALLEGGSGATHREAADLKN